MKVVPLTKEKNLYTFGYPPSVNGVYMPTYDYECRGCKHKFETFQSINDQPLLTCPECRTDQLRRLIGGGAGIIFKGSGFYINDSRKSSRSPAPKVSSPPSKPKESV